MVSILFVTYHSFRLLLKVHKRRQGKGGTEGDLERHVILHCGAEVDAGDVFLQAGVREHVNTTV